MLSMQSKSEILVQCVFKRQLSTIRQRRFLYKHIQRLRNIRIYLLLEANTQLQAYKRRSKLNIILFARIEFISVEYIFVAFYMSEKELTYRSFIYMLPIYPTKYSIYQNIVHCPRCLLTLNVRTSLCMHAFLLRNAAGAAEGKSRCSIPQVCAVPRHFNVYHRDICGCTCIINDLVDRCCCAVTVTSRDYHIREPARPLSPSAFLLLYGIAHTDNIANA